jgi:dolichol-phosphate mannosyltransferase
MNDSFILVMPAYNEEGCIEKVVSSWMELIRKYPGSEMLVINDGSKDKTGEILEGLGRKYPELKAIHKKNEGYGTTVLKCFDEAVKTEHGWVFHIDSDDQSIPEDFPKLWEKRNESNFITGRRAGRKDPFMRIITSRFVSLLNLMLFQVYIHDANIPYRLMNREYLGRILKVFPRNLFFPSMFMAVLAKKDGNNLFDIPVAHKERETGKTFMPQSKLFWLWKKGVTEAFAFRSKINPILRELKNSK